MEGDEILEEIEEAEEKVDKLRNQRDKLIEANKALIRVLKKVDEQLDLDDEEFEYSFKDGWKQKEVMRNLKLKPEEYSDQELERQINQIIRISSELDNI